MFRVRELDLLRPKPEAGAAVVVVHHVLSFQWRSIVPLKDLLEAAPTAIRLGKEVERLLAAVHERVPVSRIHLADQRVLVTIASCVGASHARGISPVVSEHVLVRKEADIVGLYVQGPLRPLFLFFRIEQIPLRLMLLGDHLVARRSGRQLRCFVDPPPLPFHDQHPLLCRHFARISYN